MRERRWQISGGAFSTQKPQFTAENTENTKKDGLILHGPGQEFFSAANIPPLLSVRILESREDFRRWSSSFSLRPCQPARRNKLKLELQLWLRLCRAVFFVVIRFQNSGSKWGVWPSPGHSHFHQPRGVRFVLCVGLSESCSARGRARSRLRCAMAGRPVEPSGHRSAMTLP